MTTSLTDLPAFREAQAIDAARAAAATPRTRTFDAMTFREAMDILVEAPGDYPAHIADLKADLVTTAEKVTDEYVLADDTGVIAATAIMWAGMNAEADSKRGFEFPASVLAKTQGSGASVGMVRGLVNCIRAQALRDAREVADAAPFFDTDEDAELKPVVELLDTLSANGLQNPRIVVSDDDGLTIRIAVAGSRSRYAGELNVTSDDRDFYDRTLYGRIDRDGTATSRLASHESVMDLLRTLAADPTTTIEAHGQRTGQCAICRRQLTNAESVERGIGPVCASKM